MKFGEFIAGILLALTTAVFLVSVDWDANLFPQLSRILASAGMGFGTIVVAIYCGVSGAMEKFKKK